MFHALGSGRGIIRKILAEWVRNVRYAMRLDDIMETMFLLAINGEWEYSNAAGEKQPLDQKTLDGLYIKRRLSEEDLNSFDGSWQPAR